MKPILCVCLLSFAIIACRSKQKYHYAIRDFKNSLQPYLIEIVTKGIVGFDTSTSFIEKHATDNELNKLSISEHPVLRAVALRALLDRENINHYDLLMSHLDDTAVVPTDAGEFGIWFSTVSDDLIENSKWQTEELKNKTIRKVITQHNYLRSAYTILSKIEPHDDYYIHIRNMANSDRNFEYLKYALYGLAKFKRKEDIPLIKETLLRNAFSLKSLSFKLMKEFPDDAYLEVMEDYFKRHLYYNICKEGYGSDADDFFDAVASYKEERSAKILSSILNGKFFLSCTTDTSSVKRDLQYSIWNNQCSAYSNMIKQITPTILRLESLPGLPIEPDTTAPVITWLGPHYR